VVTLEGWIKTVPVLALKELAVDLPGGVETAKRAKLEEHILTHVESRALAEESMRIEQEALHGRR
jgi:hypothetical protein